MTGPDTIRGWGGKLESFLRLATFPVGVKLLMKESDIPAEAIRPKRDLHHRLLLCQAFAMSRRGGSTVALLKEDMWCFEPVIGLGLGEPPEPFLDGSTRYPRSAKSREAGRNWAINIPRLDTGRYIGIVSAPLKAVSFTPDMVFIYGNSAQVMELVTAAVYRDGRDIYSRISGSAACIYATVPVIQKQGYAITLPCTGDRKYAIAQDDELIFSASAENMPELMDAIAEREKAGARMPVAFKMIHEPEMSPTYIECSRKLGMDM